MEKLHKTQGEISVDSDSVFKYDIHMHTYYEMTLYEPFDGKVSVNGRDTDIESITAILVCPSDFHEIFVNTASDAKFIKIGFDANILTDTIPDFSIIMTNIKKDSFLVDVFNEIRSKSGDKTYVKLLINTLIHLMVNNGERIIHPDTRKGYKTAVSAAKIVNESFNSNITLESAAKQLSVAPQYLSSIFKQVLGINFSDYLSDIRLNYAEKQIKNSKKSITEICFEAGYTNFSHFSRSFKKKYELSPREYRKQNA